MRNGSYSHSFRFSASFRKTNTINCGNDRARDILQYDRCGIDQPLASDYNAALEHSTGSEKLDEAEAVMKLDQRLLIFQSRCQLLFTADDAQFVPRHWRPSNPVCSGKNVLQVVDNVLTNIVLLH